MFEVTTGMHVGTHLDAPLHMIPGGRSLPEIPPEKFFGRGVLIDAREKSQITVDLLTGTELQPGDAVLLHTGFSRHFREARYYQDFPTIAEDFAAALVAARIHLLGLDTPSPDRAPYPIHRQLLSAEIVIAENLTRLDRLLGIANFEVIALPVKFKAEAAPARVVARVKD